MVRTGPDVARQLSEAEGLIREGACEMFTGRFDEFVVSSASATR
jgi:hypothetical protein